MEHYAAERKKEFLPSGTTWMKLESIMPNPLISKSALFPGPIPFKLGRFYHTLSFWHSTPSRCWDKFTQLCLCQITQVKEILVALAMGEARSKPCGQYG